MTVCGVADAFDGDNSLLGSRRVEDIVHEGSVG